MGPDGTTDMGVLRVEVIGAKDLMAADRSGKSDASLVFFDDNRMLMTSSLMSCSRSMVPRCSNPRRSKSGSEGPSIADYA